MKKHPTKQASPPTTQKVSSSAFKLGTDLTPFEY